jgi:hypothetical protein
VTHFKKKLHKIMLQKTKRKRNFVYAVGGMVFS